MSKQIKITADAISLPNGVVATRGQTVTLSDADFDRIPDSDLPENLYDLASPPPTPPPIVRGSGGGVVVVVAGADPAAARPSAAVVYWKCASGVTPTNAIPGDIIFTAS